MAQKRNYEKRLVGAGNTIGSAGFPTLIGWGIGFLMIFAIIYLIASSS